MSVDCPIYGDKSYLVLAAESSIGVLPGSPVYVYTPVLNYGVELQPEQRQPMPYTGMAEEFDTIIGAKHTAGPISLPLYGWHLSPLTASHAEYMMAWAFTDLETLCGLASKTAQWAEGPNVANKGHKGCTVNSATLTGSDDNGSSIVLNLDILGQDEAPVTTAQTIPAGLTRLNEFLFKDSTFEIGPDDESLVPVEYKGFTWQQQRNLVAVYNGSLTPRRFRTAKPAATFDINLEKSDGTWDAIRRSNDSNNYYGRLTLKGAHNGTGTVSTDYAQVVIDFPKLSFGTKKDAWTRNGPTQEQLTFRIQKPSTTDASHIKTWSDV